jgi:hypothetical protein
MKTFQIRLFFTSKVILVNAPDLTTVKKLAKSKYPNQDKSICEIVDNKTLSDLIHSIKRNS